MHRFIGSTAGLAIVLLTACSDAPAPTGIAPSLDREESSARGTFHRYVAIGTSITMGWQSDGVLAASQRESWAAQLANLTGRELAQPLISGAGCRAPLAAPLASGKRIDGEGAATPAGSFLCAPLEIGVQLPTQNLAIASATTADALLKTPAAQADPFYSKLYPLVLPAGLTQVTAMEGQHPKFVSIELGANDVLGATSGIAIAGATIVPFASWAPVYTTIVERADAVAKRGVLVGLIHDVGTFPGFRRGSELWADRAAFLAAFHVEVNSDCDASANLLFVPVRVPTAIATGLGRKANGLTPFVLSCTGGPPTSPDFVLTPAEALVVNDQLGQMNAHIRMLAREHRFAYFELESLYGRPKVPFSAVALMTTPQPYGPLVSLDGVHPSDAGHAILARAAARAINDRYDLRIPSYRPQVVALR